MSEIIKGQTYTDEAVVVDGKYYFNCEFVRCILVYKGGPPPHFNRCAFDSPELSFIDAAANTMGMLGSLYHSPFKPQIEQTFENIKKAMPSESPQSQSLGDGHVI